MFNLVYRPPSAPTDSVHKFADWLRTAEKNSIIIGGFNLPDIDWLGGTAKGRSREFLDATEECLMSQMVEFSTHIKGNILDLVLTNSPERIVDVYEAGRLGRSDHVMIATRVSVGKEREEENEEMPNWRKADWDSMRNSLAAENWNNLLAEKSVNQAWAVLTEKLQKAVEKFVPKRRRRNRDRPAWLTQEILREIRKKKRLWMAAKVGEKIEQYRTVEKRVKTLIRNAKRKLERRLAEGNGDRRSKKQFYSYVKQKTKSRPTVGPLKRADGTVEKDNKGMAEMLNTYFSSVFTRQSSQKQRNWTMEKVSA